MVRQTLQKNLNIQPTIEVRPGYRFNVIVKKDIVSRPTHHDEDREMIDIA